MIRSYKDIFSPDKIGGAFFLKTVYSRSFFSSIYDAAFGVVFIKLQGLVLTVQEIAIIGQILSLAVFLTPLLGSLRLKALATLTIGSELFMFSIPLVYVLGLIDAKTFLYLFTASEVICILIYTNMTSVFQNYVQSKTKPETAEHRQRGKVVTAAGGGILGSILTVIVSGITDDITHILYLLLVLLAMTNITMIITNRSLLRFAFDDEKYPVIGESVSESK